MHENLDAQVMEIGKKVDLILLVLRGNELDKNDNGLIGEVDKSSARVAKLEKWRDRILWMVVGMGAPASFGMLDFIHSLMRAVGK